MAAASQNIQDLWNALSEKSIVLPKEFWLVWEEQFIPGLYVIQRSVNACSDGISFQCGNGIAIQIEKLIVLSRQIKETMYLLDPASGAHGSVPLAVKSLISHYLGNNLQHIFWAVDARDQTSRQVILSSIQEILVFVTKLRKATTADPA